MTIYYNPEFQGGGGPPHPSTCPYFPTWDAPIDHHPLLVTIHEDKWKIVDPSLGRVLAEFPLNQYHQVTGYIAVYVHTAYNAISEEVRPSPQPEIAPDAHLDDMGD